MTHATPLSNIVFQKPDGSTGELDIHDSEALHDEEGSVDSTNLAEHSVHEDDIAPGAVTSSKIADGAVGRDQLDPDFVEDWDSLSQKMESSYIMEEFSKPYSVTSTLQAAVTIPIDTPEGYEPTAFWFVDSGDGKANAFRWRIDSKTYVSLWIRTLAALSATATVGITFSRSE